MVWEPIKSSLRDDHKQSVFNHHSAPSRQFLLILENSKLGLIEKSGRNHLFKKSTVAKDGNKKQNENFRQKILAG